MRNKSKSKRIKGQRAIAANRKNCRDYFRAIINPKMEKK